MYMLPQKEKELYTNGIYTIFMKLYAFTIFDELHKSLIKHIHHRTRAYLAISP